MDMPLKASLLSKLTWRIAWVTALLFMFSYIDRINIGLVAVQMNKELGLSAAQFGLGAGIFFIGYAVFEIPSNLILYRVGARRWLGRIMITWGLIASCMAFVQGATGFFVVRFLLGAAEAGFQPGVIYYLSQWFPSRERARAVATFNSAIPLGVILAAPATGFLLSTTDGAFGVAGWRWVLFLEGLPSVVLGVWTIFRLPDQPGNADWLTPPEREELTGLLAAEGLLVPRQRHEGWLAWSGNRHVWAYSGLFVLLAGGGYGVVFWLPQIINGFGKLSPLQLGLLTAVPFLCAFLAMRAIARVSDQTDARKQVVAACAFLAGIGLIGSAYASGAVALVCLSLATIGIWSSYNPFWAMPTRVLTGVAAAGGLACINSVGQLGGFAAPYVVGLIREASQSYRLGLLSMAAVCIAAGVIALLVPYRRRDAIANAMSAPSVAGTRQSG